MPEAELPVQPDAPDANVNQLTEGADAPAEPTENEAEPSPAPDDAGDKPKKPHWATKRIDELTHKVREQERREIALLEALRARHEDEPRVREPVKEPEPSKTLADFGYDEGKFYAHMAELSRTSAVAAAKEELRKERESQAAADRNFEHETREETFAKDIADYHEVTRARDLSITQTMADTVRESENGPQILYHLGKNPRLAEQIARLPPLQQAREIGRIEAKIGEKPQAPKVSQAPPPAPHLAAVEPALSVKPDSPDSDKMSDSEWARQRQKQVNRKR